MPIRFKKNYEPPFHSAIGGHTVLRPCKISLELNDFTENHLNYSLGASG